MQPKSNSNTYLRLFHSTHRHGESMSNLKLFLFGVVTLFSSLLHATELKVAAVEFASKSPGFESNLKGLIEAVTAAAKNGAKLMVLPEASMNGFLYANGQALMPYADTIPGKATAALSKVTQQYNVYVVAGLYEKDPVTGKIYNAAALIGPRGYIGKYQKNNLAPGEGNVASPGTLGFPVFETDIGKIGLVICYDDSSLQNLLLPALRGADIIAQPIGSFKIPAFTQLSYTNHSTLANISTAVSWLGTNVISSNSTGVEGPGAGFVTFDGGSSVWNNNGKRLVSAAVSTWTDHKAPETVYATINLSQKSKQKEYWLKHRRPELYQTLNNYRYPDDAAADRTSRQISALLVQYEPKSGDIDANFKKIEALIRANTGVFNLSILPFNSFLGPVNLNKENIAQYAEELNGKSHQLAASLARKYQTYVLVSMPEKKGSQFFETAILLDFNGKQIGLYRKSHLNEAEKSWATAGNELPVFKTKAMGNVAIMLNDEVRIPEITQMYGVNRADIILVPTMYNQNDYGGSVDIPKGAVSEASNRGMSMWYSIAKYAQAYTLVSNYIHGEQQAMGQSALYALTPEINYSPPNIAPNKEIAHPVIFTTHTNKTLYIDQERLIASRRWDQAAPLTLDMESTCFKEWQKNSSSKELCPEVNKQK